MSPREADPSIRDALVDAAAQVLAEEGPGALSTRRLADMVGSSTTAVYTRFGGMDELRRALRIEGFARFAQLLETVEPCDDPVTELVELGAAYIANAERNSHLYRFMFMERPRDEEVDVELATFERLVDTVRRAIQAGRFHADDPRKLAMQLWIVAHGAATLILAGLLTVDEGAEITNAAASNLFVGFGDDPASAHASVRQALRRRAGQRPPA